MIPTPAVMPGAKPLGARMLPPHDDPEPATLPETPLPPPPPANGRFGPLYGIQYLRREGVRLAIDYYRDDDRPSVEELLGTAAQIAAFIRNGTTKGS